MELTNIQFLARLLHEDLRGYIREYSSWLSRSLKSELLTDFLDISNAMGTGRVSPEVVDALLDDLGIIDIRKPTILSQYSLVYNDRNKVLVKSTYEKFSNLVYKEFAEQAVKEADGKATDLVSAIRDSEFYLPPFDTMNSDTFQEMNFSEIDINDVLEDLGTSLKSSFQEINDSSPIGGYISGQVVMVLGPPSSGKTLFMMNEAVEACKQGKKVLYVAIGDLKRFDFITRICGMVMKVPMTTVAVGIKHWFKETVETYPYLENLKIQFLSPDVYTAGDWYKINKNKGYLDDVNVYFIDYDTNFASAKDSMYAKGDEVYTMAYRLSQAPNTFVFMGSQPKIHHWNAESLGLESASESSRKQQIIDYMITISKDQTVNGRNHVGTIRVPKNRRGSDCQFNYFLDPTGNMVSISKKTYSVIKEETEACYIFENNLTQVSGGRLVDPDEDDKSVSLNLRSPKWKIDKSLEESLAVDTSSLSTED